MIIFLFDSYCFNSFTLIKSNFSSNALINDWIRPSSIVNERNRPSLCKQLCASPKCSSSSILIMGSQPLRTYCAPTSSWISPEILLHLQHTCIIQWFNWTQQFFQPSKQNIILLNYILCTNLQKALLGLVYNIIGTFFLLPILRLTLLALLTLLSYSLILFYIIPFDIILHNYIKEDFELQSVNIHKIFNNIIF